MSPIFKPKIIQINKKQIKIIDNDNIKLYNEHIKEVSS